MCSDMLDRFRFECLNNMPLYMNAIAEDSSEQMIIDMIRYIYFRDYNSSLIDILPHIMSNILAVNIFIVEKMSNGNFNVHSTNISERKATFNVYLYKSRDHYDACIPSSLKSLSKQ